MYIYMLVKKCFEEINELGTKGQP